MTALVTALVKAAPGFVQAVLGKAMVVKVAAAKDPVVVDPVETVKAAVDQVVVVREVLDQVTAVAAMAAMAAEAVMAVVVAMGRVEADRIFAAPSARHLESSIAACCGQSARCSRLGPSQTDR